MLLILNHPMEVLLQLNVSPYLHHLFLSCLLPFLQKIINQFHRSFYPFQYILCIFLRKKSCEWLYNCGYVCAVAAHLTGIHSAIKMLNSRIRVLHHYLLAMQKGVCLFCLFRNLNLFKVVEERIRFSLRKNIEERTKSSGERGTQRIPVNQISKEAANIPKNILQIRRNYFCQVSDSQQVQAPTQKKNLFCFLQKLGQSGSSFIIIFNKLEDGGQKSEFVQSSGREDGIFPQKKHTGKNQVLREEGNLKDTSKPNI